MRKIRTGDKVIIISGNEKGKTGKVTALVGKDRVIVEGLNLVSKHIKKGIIRKDAPGQIIAIPAPIHISNVQVVCPICGKPTRVAIGEKDGKRVRICRKCGAAIDLEAKNLVKKVRSKKLVDKKKEDEVK